MTSLGFPPLPSWRASGVSHTYCVTNGKMVNFVSGWTLSRSVWVCQKCCVASSHTSSNPQIQEFPAVAQGGYISPCTPCLALLAWNINPEGPYGRGHSYTYCAAMSLVASVFLWCLCQAIRRAVSQELTGQESQEIWKRHSFFFIYVNKLE